MKIGDRVKLSVRGLALLGWDSTGTIASVFTKDTSDKYDWDVQWDDDPEGYTIAQFEYELEVI